MPPRPSLALRHAVALGIAHGPCELLPISSSAHTTLIPWLAGWPYGRLDAELRKSFEVALHAGTAAAVVVDLSRRERARQSPPRPRRPRLAWRPRLARMRRGGGCRESTHLLDGRHRDGRRGDTHRLDGRRAWVIALSLPAPIAVGYALEERIQRLLGGPRTIAGGLLAGALAMALADARDPAGSRRLEDAGALDGLLLGAAQALALIPGISRSGATLSAARARGFGREHAQTLSRQTGLPVILGASALKGRRMIGGGAPAGARPALAVGAAAAFLSTFASIQLARRGDRDGRSLLPYCLYRGALAAIVIGRLARAHNMDR